MADAAATHGTRREGIELVQIALDDVELLAPDPDHPQTAGVGHRGGERRRGSAAHAGLLHREPAADQFGEAVHRRAPDTADCIARRYLRVALCCTARAIGGQALPAHMPGRDTARMSKVMSKSAPRVTVNDSSPCAGWTDSVP